MATYISFVVTWVRNHIASERGQDLIEYAMLSGLIALALTGAAVAVYTGAVSSMAQGISDCIDFKSSTTCL
jgi:Flp pilus assembly pilin Flp